MDYVLNSGQDRILNGLKSYLGNDENKIMSTVNKQLLGLGKKEHVYHFKETMDRNMADFDIKKVLMDFLNAMSWENVPEYVKKVCYNGYPVHRELPVWDTILDA